MNSESVILTEGSSDAAVLKVLARRLGLDPAAVSVVPMGGVTNVGRHLRDLAERPEVNVAGLVDAGETRFVVGALNRLGHAVGGGPDELAAYGFFVCRDDLEDELIRALGTDAVIEVIEREGELGPLHTLQQQPAQRARSVHDQLHRFSGTKAGRKVRLATALAEELPLDDVPAPLLGVLRFAERHPFSRGRGSP